MKTIWKFTLQVNDQQSILMPEGAEILCVQTQRDEACLWALCDSEAPKTRKRHFAVRGTGHPCGVEITVEGYIGTVQFEGGALIFHVFETRD